MSDAPEKLRQYWEDVRPGVLPLSPVEDGDAVTYHRHWIILVRNLAVPFVIGLFDIFVWVTFFTYGDVARLLRLGWHLNLGLLAVSLAPAVWLLWRYEDWRNDYYVVTSERVVDVDRRPFGFGGEVREAPMANVQNVSMQVPGFLATTLDFGNINVETAGQQSSLVFRSIHHPRDVLARVAAKVDEFRETRMAQEQEARQQELTTWFSTYADLNRIAVVESPATARVGDEAEIAWRVSGPAEDLDTWLEWKLGDAVYRVSTQSGGPGNYRGGFTVPLAREIAFQAGARTAGGVCQSAEERLLVSDFELLFPAEAPAGRPLSITWRHAAPADHAELLWDTRSHGREDAYPHLETANFEGGAWTYSLFAPDAGSVFFRLRSRISGVLLYSPEHKVSLHAPLGHVD